jgi:hypothetical protein
MVVFFPHVHGTAHHQQEIIRRKRGYGFAPVQHDRIKRSAARRQELAKQAGRLVIHVLKAEGA